MISDRMLQVRGVQESEGAMVIGSDISTTTGPGGSSVQLKRALTRGRASGRMSEVRLVERFGRQPYSHVMEGPSATHTRVEGQMRLNLASNNYLGLATDARVIKAAAEAVRVWGAGTAGSRLMSGNLKLHAQLEAALCEFLNREACLVFATGYTANLGLLSSLASPADAIVADEEVHASCYDGAKLSGAELRAFPHNDVGACNRALTADSKSSLCIVEGVYSMSGDVSPLRGLGEACRSSPALFVVDEAHSFGVLGATGRGAAQHAHAEENVDAIMLTLSKSLAGCGGVIAGPQELVDLIHYTARPFIFTASNTPSSLAGALAALSVLRDHPEYASDVRERAHAFSVELRELGVPHRYGGGGIVVVDVGSDFRTLQAWKMLWNRGVFCNAAVHPAVSKSCGVLRFSFMRTHVMPDVIAGARTCQHVLGELTRSR